MASTYPYSADTFSTKADGPGHYVFAAYFNDLQDAVLATENTLGLVPAGSAGTVAARLTAIESATGGGASTAVLTSPNGTRYRIAVANDGTLSTTQTYEPGPPAPATATLFSELGTAADPVAPSGLTLNSSGYITFTLPTQIPWPVRDQVFTLYKDLVQVETYTEPGPGAYVNYSFSTVSGNPGNYRVFTSIRYWGWASTLSVQADFTI